MKRNSLLNHISIKLGLLFSSIFLTLLLILGSILYGVFTNLFVDFVTKDLLVRGGNHAKALVSDYSQETIRQVLSMEKGSTARVVITDANQKIVGSSEPLDEEMENHILKTKNRTLNKILDKDWKKHQYMVTISTIDKNKGYVYMFYPSNVLQETDLVLKILILAASFGTIFIALGLIGILSRRLTNPLLIMKDATNRMALGKYKQQIPSKGNDEIAQLANSIQQLGEKLQSYEDTRNEFLNAVSHELRTPLTYIKGYSDILNKGIIKSESEQKEYLQIIHNEAKRVAFLVDDLFEMSKLQVGEFILHKEFTDLKMLIEKVMEIFRPAAVEKGLTLKSHLDEHLPDLFIDAHRMEQVLYNLIENAVKYTEQGEVTVRTFNQKEFIVIEIKDTGIGIPNQDMSKIWDRFYRVDKSRTRKTGGTGLGLYIAKQIIEAHDGRIEVSSIEDIGTTFTIFLQKPQKVVHQGRKRND
ncbi:sensor histidine kinase [Bacillota bacterium Lsc_1132]